VNILEAVLNQQGGTPVRASGGLPGMLTPFIDQNCDGSTVDDVLGQAGKLFGGQ
jgi:hypothetical protein